MLADGQRSQVAQHGPFPEGFEDANQLGEFHVAQDQVNCRQEGFVTRAVAESGYQGVLDYLRK